MVGKLVDVEELLGERGFDAVFVATGAGLPSYMGIEGEGSTACASPTSCSRASTS